MSEKRYLEVKDLVVEYTADGSVIQAVNGVSFELEKGKTIGLVGETGAGKTTIAKAIMRILPNPPAHIRGGEIFLDGVDLLQLSKSEMQKVRGAKVSMVFQDPMTALNPTMRVGDQIMEMIMLHKDISKAECKKMAEDMLEMVGIPASRYREYPHQFSGGMKQRVVIAMALACDPELLIADEPTTALDVTIQAQVLDMMLELKEKKNTSMIMITHDLGIVAEVCDTVAVIYAGEVIESGTKEEIFFHPTHPYTIGLFGAIPHLHEDVERLSPVPGLPPDPSKLPVGCSFSPRCPRATEKCYEMRCDLAHIDGTHYCRCMNLEEVK